MVSFNSTCRTSNNTTGHRISLAKGKKDKGRLSPLKVTTSPLFITATSTTTTATRKRMEVNF
jgi:hypothetical protein